MTDLSPSTLYLLTAIALVLMAWGGPTSIDHKTVTRKGAPVERWIYQLPQAALPPGMTSEVQYVWFANGRVARVEEGA